MQNVHFGEQNHTNNIVNNSFYGALGNYCKKEIEAIEASYTEARTVREKRLQERISVLEKVLSSKQK